MHEKPNTPRSCLRWKPTGRIFKTAGLRWIPTGKMFIDCITKVDSEPLNGSNDDITNPYECDQTLNVSACTLNQSTAAIQEHVVSTGTPSSTRIDQDIPFTRDDENATNPPPVPPTPQASHTLLTIKLLIRKKGNGHVQVLTDTHGQVRVLPPKTAEEILARERERKARTTLLIVIPEDHLAKFYKITDAKEMWEAIKSEFGGNDKSKKMQIYILKQQFERFYVSPLKMPIRSFLGLYLLPSPNINSTNEVSTAYVFLLLLAITHKRKALHHTLMNSCIDWAGHTEDDTENYAFMAFNSSNSSSDTKDKSRLRYGNQMHEGALSYENEVLESVFDSQSSDVEDNYVNDRFAKVEGMHVVPPLKSDFGIDESKFTNVESKPKAVSEPEVWSDAPIIEEYESDSDDEYVFKDLVEQEKPSCAFINIVKHVKTPRQIVKDQDTCSQNPKVPKRDWTSLMSKRLGLGYCYTRKACFVCGSFSHFIRDCNLHEK
nr:xylulose kinase-1 [Tanacetum cinerariifolium]